MQEISGIPMETVRAYNSRLVRLCSLYLNLCPRAIDKEQACSLAKECGISLAEAVANLFAAYLELDVAGKDRLFFRYWVLPCICEQDVREFCRDPYLTQIKSLSGRLGSFELKSERIAPFELFVRRDFLVLPDGRMLPQLGFFTRAYTFPAVLENGREWMTLQPNEIVTARPALSLARGRVLTFGMGLGYFAFHAARKPEVESVTVVDISADVLELFRTRILPRIPNAHKIRTVQKDAFAFAEEDMAGNFDFVFADIWHDAGDGRELYLKMKEYEARFPEITFTYWLEDTIKAYLRPELWGSVEG